jgi:phytol kinase
MSRELYYFLILGTAYLLLFGTAEYLYRKRKWQAEHTRKLVHASSGLLALLFPFCFDSHWWVMALCGAFLLILVASKRYGFLQSINGVERKTYGSDLFPIAVYFLFVFYKQNDWKVYADDHDMLKAPEYLFYHPLLILALCDPIAALIGKNRPWIPFQIFNHTKTVSGSLGFLLSSMLITGMLFWIMGDSVRPVVLLSYILISGMATALGEAFTTKGTDNFVIVAVAAGVDYLFLL